MTVTSKYAHNLITVRIATLPLPAAAAAPPFVWWLDSCTYIYDKAYSVYDKATPAAEHTGSLNPKIQLQPIGLPGILTAAAA